VALIDYLARVAKDIPVAVICNYETSLTISLPHGTGQHWRVSFRDHD